LDPVRQTRRRRTLIYGAGDGGELVLNELQRNRTLGCSPVGFVDDDPLKEKRVIHGLHVFGGNGALNKILREQRVEEVIISGTQFPAERVEAIRAECEEANVMLKRMSMQIENISERHHASF